MVENNELRNLLRRCINPLVLGWMILFIIRRLFFSLQYRYLPSRWYYPKEMREAFDRVAQAKHHNSPQPPLNLRGGNSSQVPPLRLRGGEEGLRSGRLKLATGFFEYEGEPDWRRQFDDQEQTMSLHRWHWLIYDEMDKEQGVALMRSWISKMGPVPLGVAGTSYTTGERIINTLLFFDKKGSEVSEDIGAALLRMAYHVAERLEYHGVRATGNHVINNARALFFAGQMLKVKELSDLALVISKEALPWLVTKDGFLREESSHYHLLFTRWILEMYELAKNTSHNEMETYLALWVKKLAERCWFFMVEDTKGRWQIPLIGDVSPDCTPEWLVRYLIPYFTQYKPLRWLSNGMQAFSESGWFRLDHGPATIFWHIPQTNMIHRATHGHSDLVSFVLFNNSTVRLVDPGRFNYKSDHGCQAQAHNSLTVDGLGPTMYDRVQKFSAFYQRRKIRCDWKQEDEEFVFSIFHTGFRRIKGDCFDHLRRFRVSAASLTVEDELAGKRSHNVETFFHFAPGAEKLDIQHSAGDRETINGWTFPSYGVKISSASAVFQSRVTLPATIRYRIDF